MRNIPVPKVGNSIPRNEDEGCKERERERQEVHRGYEGAQEQPGEIGLSSLPDLDVLPCFTRGRMWTPISRWFSHALSSLFIISAPIAQRARTEVVNRVTARECVNNILAEIATVAPILSQTMINVFLNTLM
ncbi:unnamed protein product [Nezara viridula]|uniref:Uncharacterized protein n=1 Tax=Nezara viridula TaxID=85310 RepID=A0A9P0H7R3_NEZVI|nr:unnamed protein product [Nezara viridula]